MRVGIYVVSNLVEKRMGAVGEGKAEEVALALDEGTEGGGGVLGHIKTHTQKMSDSRYKGLIVFANNTFSQLKKII